MTFTPAFKNTDARWGAGNGAGVAGKLSSLQGDENVYGLWQLVLALQAAGPVEISDITFSGGALTIHLSDSTTRGPFQLPIAKLSFKGVWQNSTLYHYLDLVWVRGTGLFFVNEDHTTPASPAVFDPTADDGTTAHNLLYEQFGPLINVNYDLPLSFPGHVVGSTGDPLVYRTIFPRSVEFSAGLSGCYAQLGVPTSVETLVFTIEKNDASIGTITFTPGSGIVATSGPQNGTFSFLSDVTFDAGDWLSLRGPLVTDADAADLSVTFTGTRLDI